MKFENLCHPILIKSQIYLGGQFTCLPISNPRLDYLNAEGFSKDWEGGQRRLGWIFFMAIIFASQKEKCNLYNTHAVLFKAFSNQIDLSIKQRRISHSFWNRSEQKFEQIYSKKFPNVESGISS
jgi:hypothetical protein